ncbi:MAG: serine hydrolase [Oligoflexus sp.]
MAKDFFEISYYHDYISADLAAYLLQHSSPVPFVDDLREVATGGGLESPESLAFLLDLYQAIQPELKKLLEQRQADRNFIDERTKACHEFNRRMAYDYLDPDYQTVLGMEDAAGRIVVGPLQANYCEKGGPAVAPIPEFLQGPHVTLFGPPDSAKMAINAMNAYHRQVKGEPEIVAKLLAVQNHRPKWGADNEDSKTPLRADLVDAAVNLTACFAGKLSFTDPATAKTYELAADHRSIPLKRFPGLALPCSFLFYKNNPLPLHLYDFALHIFHNWQQAEALVFYVPKIENEEEARYLHKMIATAEQLLKARHPQYVLGSVRVLLVLENPRAILRTHEMIDALYPYFVGASLGWHDYLASTARIFKEDPNYRIPVKADPSIVIKYIKASHHLLADTVGSRGGIKIGGMYGILPLSADLTSPSFQAALAGFFKDVITQLKRGLDGFWVAHPDFVRIGLALVEAWQQYQAGQKEALLQLVKDLLEEPFAQDITSFIQQPDGEGLAKTDPKYLRSLLVADLKESTLIANHDPEEVRYNVFQTLQYLADWLSGHGCVALPTLLGEQAVRVMDDLATAERSRWEVWHEIRHGRFPVERLVQIAHEELQFIRKDQSHATKSVQVKWNAQTEKWYPLAFRIMLLLMTSPRPVEFASELLLPFTLDPIRAADDPWARLTAISPDKYRLAPTVERLNYYFEKCGSLRFATELAKDSVLDLQHVQKVIHSFDVAEIIEAASFHGDIGESKSTLDQHAAKEQAKVMNAGQELIHELRSLGKSYLEKFGFKFLISAKGQHAEFLRDRLKERLNHSRNKEIENAKEALWQITQKRMIAEPLDALTAEISSLTVKHQIPGVSISIARDGNRQNLCFGFAEKDRRQVTASTVFELASLSKTLASAFAIEYFRSKGIDLSSSVNALLAKTSSSVRLTAANPNWPDAVSIRHLLSHTALNMHYVKGIAADQVMPSCEQLLSNPEIFGYPNIAVINEPGSVFQYSGGGFLLLEHLIEKMEGQRIQELIKPFFASLGLAHLSFEQKPQQDSDDACGYFDTGDAVASGRLMFPAAAAGALGTAEDMLAFLQHLEHAFHHLEGSGPISHDTAVEMLHGEDRGAQDFMGCNMGLGVFLAEAGDNRLMIHQGANEGFRAIYIHCFSGPDCGKGFVILCNADNKAVPFIAELSQKLLATLKFSGIDFQKFQTAFDTSKLKQEEIVNLGYKNLVFRAFQPTLPEEIVAKGPRDPLADFNLLVDAEICSVSNQRFARAQNLISAYLPQFDPHLFGRQGKIMDSWESARHNPLGQDNLELKIKAPAPIRFVSISTAFHDGNQAEFVRLSGKLAAKGAWQEILPKTQLQGHSLLEIDLQQATPAYPYIKVDMYPDGGLSRLGLYQELPQDVSPRFKDLPQARSQRLPASIPQSQKPLTIRYAATADEIQKNLARCPLASIDYASTAFGGRLLKASNEHYGPAVQLLSPFPPLHMFDGLESARSRAKEHVEEVVIQLGRPVSIQRIILDFTYFVNNNPVFVSLSAWVDEQWIEIVEKTAVKAYAANQKEIQLRSPMTAQKILLRTYPDGGINRLHVYGEPQ